MFGSNTIVGQKYFKNRDTLLVASRFYSLQGEGPLQGQPSVFVRLSKCNLACSFCDTYFDSGTEFTTEALLDELDELLLQHWGVRGDGQLPPWAQLPNRGMNLIITGGEPSLQANLVPFIKHVIDTGRFRRVQVESNGLIYLDWPGGMMLVVSPKCVEARTGRALHYLEPNEKTMARADCLKFVMSADDDSPYSEVPQWALRWRERTRRPVYVSPMNVYARLPNQAQRRAAGDDADVATRSLVDEVISFWDKGLLDMEANHRNHKYAARYARDNGLHLTLQQQLYAGLA